MKKKTNLITKDMLNSQDIGPPAYIISTRSICSYEGYLGYLKKSIKLGLLICPGSKSKAFKVGKFLRKDNLQYKIFFGQKRQRKNDLQKT